TPAGAGARGGRLVSQGRGRGRQARTGDLAPRDRVPGVLVLGRAGALGRREPGPERRVEVAGLGQGALRGRVAVLGGMEAAGAIEVPGGMSVNVDEPRQEGEAGQVVEPGAPSGDEVRRARLDAHDARALDDDAGVLEPAAPAVKEDGGP